MEEFNRYFNVHDYQVPQANRITPPSTSNAWLRILKLVEGACIAAVGRLDYYNPSFEIVEEEHIRTINYLYDLGHFIENLPRFPHRPRDSPCWQQP
ncbi:hypothetical protein O181_044473 [Austropuccinia psidii MF-1]|uniref:Uncharacterized protein n=1 Tax=Austropuccinia psidii MF-1 TaxID=1389203 RepID=A0A9Q3HGN5_9BASI|nr:hypothetical protein [Austropuccinia psidii MF-1]